jgi:hypothetical protein
LFLPIIAYTLSSTKLEISAKYFLLGSKGVRGRGRGQVVREGVREGWRNDPNIVCTYE